MNILYVVDMLKILGGCELHIMTLAKEMAKDNKVYILTNHYDYDFDRLLPGIEVFVEFNETNYKRLASKKIDIIHSNPFTACQVGHELSKRFNADHFVTMHGNNMSGLTSEIVKDCKKIIFINEVAKNTCQGLVPEDKGIIIQNPVDATKFKARPVRTKKIQNLLNRDFKTIVVPSRVDDGKEIPMFQLVRILPVLAERVGGLNVIFLGDGNKLPELAETAYKLQTKKLNLHFIAQADAVYNYINVADLVLACDRCAIEALLCKKIVFYMGQAKWKQLIQNENYYQALFTEQGYTDYSDNDLLGLLTWMLTQAETVKLHTDKVYENVKELCDSEKVKEKIYNLYKKKL